jgi:cob(I)alamin adenosyltransferase
MAIGLSGYILKGRASNPNPTICKISVNSPDDDEKSWGITSKHGGTMRSYSKPSERIADSRRRTRCCGTIDELISQMGFARSICPDIEVRKRIKALQLDLYSLGAVIAAPTGAKNLAAAISSGMIDVLEAEIHRMKGLPGVLRDGSLFWELPAAAALDVARTISRRADRVTKTLIDEGELGITFISAYLNRLAELLWLLCRLLESRHGVNY